MTADLKSWVRAHPLEGIAGAVVAGYLLGRMLR
jgi:hypothetical protein